MTELNIFMKAAPKAYEASIVSKPRAARRHLRLAPEDSGETRGKWWPEPPPASQPQRSGEWPESAPEALGGTPQYGLIAEEVEKVVPELVVYGADGKVETVAYQMLPAMLLLNEVQKQRELVRSSPPASAEGYPDRNAAAAVSRDPETER